MKKNQPFFYRSSVKKTLVSISFIVAIALIFVEMGFNRQSLFLGHSGEELDAMIGFYGLVGGIGSFCLVIITKLIASAVRTNEDYYDNDF